MSDPVEDFVQQILPRPPRVQLPVNIPTINVPLSGCFSGDGHTYVGKHFGNRPDFLKLNHLKERKKDIADKIITFEKMQLDKPLERIAAQIEKARLTQEVVEFMEDAAELIGNIEEEIDGAVTLINGKIAELTMLQGDLNAIPLMARSAVERLLLRRYGQYKEKLTTHKGNLLNVRNCLGVGLL